MKQTLLFLFLFTGVILFGQEVNGVVVDENGEGLYGVLIDNNLGDKTRSDEEGKFAIKAPEYPLTLTFSMMDFNEQKLKLNSAPTSPVTVKMKPDAQMLEGVVVSASRREQKIEEVSVSLEIIKPELIENKGISSIEDAVDQAPGAYTMEGQVSIRGGSGFSYGAGSRVQVVWNDAPLLSADAGDAKWESIALENISQIEILKGASSVLYGSGALNGIISLRDKEPTKKGEIKASYQIGIYDNPKRKTLRWSEKPLMSHQLNAYYGKMYEQFGFNVSAYGFLSDGFRAGEYRKRARLNGGFIFKPKNFKRLRMGLNYSFTIEDKGNFFVWESDTFGYHPLGGRPDPYQEGTSASTIETFRAMVDPYLVTYDKYNNKHSVQTRFYNTTNKTGENSSVGNMIFADYKFDRDFKGDWHLTAGTTGQWGIINSLLYGDHKSQNYAFYGQVDKKFGPVTLTAGMRAEYYRANDLEPDSKMYLSKDSTKAIPFRPIFRAGMHYKAAEHTHIRASIGQAYRYPSIAERFASTSIGKLNIFTNPDLKSEQGWSAEIGVKQGFKIGNFKGFVDVAGFINEYQNMIEFTFGYFKPDSVGVPNLADLPKYYGFRAENAERARILGAELSINGIGNIGPVEITALLGYTYMNPVVLNPDSVYMYGNPETGNGGVSNPESNMLKYRFRHLAKGDIQAKWKGLMIGFSARYNSFMENIDKTFEEGAVIIPDLITEQILVGLKEYRQKHNKGDLVMDARVGYQINKNFQVHFIVNNIANREYVTRPGDIRAPREFMLRVQMDF